MTDDSERTTLTDPVLALCGYWFSARVMHYHVHDLMDAADRDIDRIVDAGLKYEFFTYIAYWLSALYVVCEGFRELKLIDGILEPLIEAHIEELRLFRHTAFHFHKRLDKQAQFFGIVGGGLNWAEELHSEFEEYFSAYVADTENSAPKI